MGYSFHFNPNSFNYNTLCHRRFVKTFEEKSTHVSRLSWLQRVVKCASTIIFKIHTTATPENLSSKRLYSRSLRLTFQSETFKQNHMQKVASVAHSHPNGRRLRLAVKAAEDPRDASAHAL